MPDKEWFEKYENVKEKLNCKNGFPPDEEDFEYTWEYLEDSIAFWKKAAEEGRYVLFTVDR